MIYLEDLTDDEKDEIRIEVSNSYLNLKLRNLHKGLLPYHTSLLKEIGNKYNEELKAFMYCSFTALNKIDSGLYYSRNNITYTNFNKENPSFKPISWRKIKGLVDKLEGLGYIESYSGYNDRVE